MTSGTRLCAAIAQRPHGLRSPPGELHQGGARAFRDAGGRRDLRHGRGDIFEHSVGHGGRAVRSLTRMSTIALFAIAAALLGETQVSNAQSPYSYPWCAIYPGDNNGPGGALSCYYTSWEQCRTTMFGIGGNCVQSPYYHAQPIQLPRRAATKPRHHRHDRTVRLSTPERLE